MFQYRGMSLIENKKVRLNYNVLRTLEAGLELYGHEVKSLRGGLGKLDGSHVVVRGGEAYIVGMSIPPYQPKNTSSEYDPSRARKLLLTKKEILLLAGYESQKGLTVVPLAVYNKKAKLKISIGVARGRKTHDKREHLKQKDARREMERTLKKR